MIQFRVSIVIAWLGGPCYRWCVDSYRQRWGIGTELYDGIDPQQIALTFDDGPNDPYTFQLIDVLAKRGARATFFMVGRYVRHRPDIARAVLAAGHVIGNHTEEHPNLTSLSREDVEAQLSKCQNVIEDATGFRPSFFRPPFGASSDLVDAAARMVGLKGVIWSVIPQDWAASSAGLIVRRVCAAVDSRAQGEIVLLHDGAPESFGADRSCTVGATRKLLAKYSTLGKQFIGVPELIVRA
jgi:peptidoglycan/xylan/chitin deacetylase (PgdA/CDA1 family)